MSDMDLGKIYTDLMEKTAEIDEKLDSLSDTQSAGKRATINKLVDTAQDSWQPLLNKFEEQLADAPADVMAGFYFGLIRGMDKAFSEKAKLQVDELVKTMPAPTPLINAEDVPALQALRSKFYQQIKATVNLAEQFGGEDVAAAMPLPKKRTGSKGPRGKRALSYYKFYVDDKSYETLTDVVGDYPQFDKVKDLRAAIVEAGSKEDPSWDLTTPPYRWEFTLPDGKILVGEDTRPEEGEDTEDEDEDTEDEGTEEE